ncbi:Ion channel [Cooperia oncophora]
MFCPITWIIIRDIGQLALVYLTTVYARLKMRFTSAGEKEDEVFMVPVSICLLICILIMLFGTLWVHSYDALTGPPSSGMDWFLALYFTFQTFTTIGLGDVMPNNIPFEPIICSVFFFSLPMIKVINRMCYLSLENGVHGAFAVVSNKLDAYCKQSKKASVASVTDSSTTTPDENAADETDITNQLTIHSIATFMQSNADVYGGRLGQVNLRKSDIVPE